MNIAIKVLGMICSLSFMACNNISSSNEKEFDEPVTQQAVAELNGVNNPELVRIEVDGVLKLTAENGKATGPEIKYMPEWRAFGWFTAKDKVEWEVEVQKAGEYQTTLEWSVSDEEAGKEFLLETKNQKLTGKVAPSGSWETFKTEPIGTVKLEAGIQNITFKSNQHFDKGAILDLREIRLTLLK